MKKYWAMKWARDLETTKAKQAKGVLNNSQGGFCCLGRLCVVAGMKGRRARETSAMLYDGSYQIIPPSLQGRVGMRTSNGSLTDSKALAALNDIGTPFPELAKIIRKHWRDL